MRSLPWKTLGAGLAVAITLAACADIFGLKNAESGDASVSPDGGSDAPSDGIAPYDANKDVVTIPDANFAQCDGGVDDLTGAVFVSNTHPNKNSSSCGAATQPCSSIKIGIGVAAQQVPHKVVLANDVFDEVVELDQSLTNGMMIEGGYSLDYTQQDQNGNPAWVPKCATNLAQIVEGAGHPEPYVVRISQTSSITLRLLSIQSRDSKNYGESVYGIQVIDSSSVTLDNVVVLAENGGDGVPGMVGGSNNPPTFCGVDAGGSSGSNAPAGDAGSFQSDGYHVVQAPSGTSGDWGTYTPPMQGVCNNSCESCSFSTSIDSGPTCNANPFPQCGGFGTGGCNGARGLAGSGGAGGGATVALYVYGTSSVTLANGTVFQTASGGTGGKGANGGSGDAGTTGSPGASVNCATTCGAAGDGGCAPTSSVTLDGGPGGVGGPGGNGGTGGGGAGGPSYLVVRVLPATLTPSFVSSVGDAGPGRPGDGGGPNGQTGDQASIKVF